MPDSRWTYTDAQEMLQRTWGYPDFRPAQQEVIRAISEGTDVLAVLPTGGGKSLLYQVPGLLEPGLTLVISPLIALMSDQVAALQRRNIRAAFISSALGARAVEQIFTNAEHGLYKFLYLAPERLQSELFQARIGHIAVSRLAIDEAHCISEWGPNFRPAYRRIMEAREVLRDVPVLAVTATATPRVRQDMLDQLGMTAPRVFVQGFDRPNLIWSRFHTFDKRGKVREILEAVPGPAIIYAGSRKSVTQWAADLRQDGITAEAYHAGLSTQERHEAQQRWMDNRCRVITATNAFGMGIDKPDVRVVIHVALPSTLESYYQEAGRGGRDGRTSHAVLLYQPGDEQLPTALIERSHPSKSDVQAVYQATCSFLRVAYGDHPEEPLIIDLERLSALTRMPMGSLATGLEVLERLSFWEIVADPVRPERRFVRFLRAREQKPRIDMHHVDRSRTTALSRMDSMVAYAQTFQCRRYFLRTYYGESAPAQCGKCDVCLERHVPIHPTPKDEHVIKQLLMQIKQDGQPGAVPQTTAARREGLLRWLYQEGWIEQADPFRNEWHLSDKTRTTLKM